MHIYLVRHGQSHVNLADLDQDGLLDVLYVEAQLNTVRWIRQSPRGVFTEQILADGVSGPAHVDTTDLYGNGRLDVLVACMGQIAPNNSRDTALSPGKSRRSP